MRLGAWEFLPKGHPSVDPGGGTELRSRAKRSVSQAIHYMTIINIFSWIPISVFIILQETNRPEVPLPTSPTYLDFISRIRGRVWSCNLSRNVRCLIIIFCIYTRNNFRLILNLVFIVFQETSGSKAPWSTSRRICVMFRRKDGPTSATKMRP